MNTKFINFKAANITLSVSAFVISFLLIFYTLNTVTGDLVTLMYGGKLHPDYDPLPMTSFQDYEQRLEIYEQTKDELGIYDFPFSIVNLLLNLLRFDFGTFYAIDNTSKPIFEDLLEFSPHTVMLSGVGVLFSLVLLIPLCILRYNKEITEEKTPFETIIKLISIFGPVLFLLWFILLFTTSSWDLFPRFWRDDAFPFTFFYPGLFLILTGVVSGSIVLSLGYSNRTVLKIGTIATILVEFWTETFFVWPGLGWYFYWGFESRNYPIIFVIAIIFALAVTFMLIAIELVPSNFLSFSSKNQLPLRILKVQDNKKLLFEVIIIQS